MRPLSTVEVERLSHLTELDIPVGLIQPTRTALGKSIIDATESFRDFLVEERLHHYHRQPQGEEHKRQLQVRILGRDLHFHDALMSLYRPRTKQGDPRLWVYGLRNYAAPDEILVFFHRDRFLYVLNLTQHDIGRLVTTVPELSDALAALGADRRSAAKELRAALEAVAARGFLDAGAGFDTTVGMLLEKELGIAPNSRRDPDFKGIEIKAARGARANRHNLFAKVPDWRRSPVGSSRELLTTFGYLREGRQQLYCTVSSLVANSQGLQLELDEEGGDVWETSARADIPRVLVWSLAALESALVAKHAETFWVEAESRWVDGREQLRFVRARHTARPIVQQFGPLVAAGNITVDHLVRDKNGVAAERGPLFKLSHGSLELLFPPARTYELLG